MFLLLGYRTSGKDTICNQIRQRIDNKRICAHKEDAVEHEGKNKVSPGRFQWQVLVKSPDVWDTFQRLLQTSLVAQRWAFAAQLKLETHLLLGGEDVLRAQAHAQNLVPAAMAEAQWDLDLVKDKLQLPAPDSAEGSSSDKTWTLRNWYIEIGMRRKRQDQDYWVKRVEGELRKLRDSLSPPPLRLDIITDCRFRHEIDHMRALAQEFKVPILTARVYRSHVPVPPADQPTEHDVDSVATDLVFVPADQRGQEEIAALIRQFPQYDRHVLCKDLFE